MIDGDTVDLRFASGVEPVRLLGIDTPETVARTVPVQCFGAEATDALTALLPPGTAVVVSRDVEARDHYDRLLLYLYRAEDGVFVNEWMVAHGYAEAVSYAPNTTHEIALVRAEARAKANGHGLWSACDGPDQPLDPDGT
ncbi:MAG: thermonuclease family protein [Actinomycetota bacterium]